MKKENIFNELSRNNPVVKVLDFLMTYQLFDTHYRNS